MTQNKKNGSVLKQDNSPCCICYQQKSQRSIIEYRCGRCEEGIVCGDCATKLWVHSMGSSCPICHYKSVPPNTWYKPRDIEMGLLPPIHDLMNYDIIDDLVSNDDEQDDHDDHDDTLADCIKNNIVFKTCAVTIFMTLVIILSFSFGMIFKILKGDCQSDENGWNECQYSSQTVASVVATTCWGLLFVAVCTLVYTICLPYNRQAFIDMTKNMCSQESLEYSRQILRKMMLSLLFCIGSFICGIGYRYLTNNCTFKCDGQDIVYTMVITIFLGGFILAIVCLMSVIVFSCCALCCMSLSGLAGGGNDN